VNATINVKPETRNRRKEPTGLAKRGETRSLTGTGPGLARQEAAGRVFGRVWNRTDPFLRSKPGLVAGYPDPLLTLESMPITNDYRLQNILHRACGSTAQRSDSTSVLGLGKYNHLRETYVLGVYR